jgi:hypothetical protein
MVRFGSYVTREFIQIVEGETIKRPAVRARGDAQPIR